jgi:hypothetical protein
VVQDQEPAIVFEHEYIRRVRLGSAHLFTGSGRHAFQAGHPRDARLHFHRHFSDVNAHESGVSEQLFPGCADVFPAGQAGAVGQDADGAGIGGPHFVHEIDIEAFQCEIKFQVRLDHLFGIGHKRRWFITDSEDKTSRESLKPHPAGNVDDYAFGSAAAIPDRYGGRRRNVAPVVEFG